MKRIALLALLVLVLSLFSTASMAAPQPQGPGEPEAVTCGDNISCTMTGPAVRIVNTRSGNALYLQSEGTGLKAWGRWVGAFGASSVGDGFRGETVSGTGVSGQSTSGRGVSGESSTNYGVYGENNSTANMVAAVFGFGNSYGTGIRGQSRYGWGGYFAGGQDNDPDIVAGGANATNDNGNIWSDPWLNNSDLLLFSNDEVHVHLDEDNNETGNFDVYGGNNARAFQVQEDGDVLVGLSLYLRTLGGQGNIYATSQNASDMWLGSNDDVFVDLDNDNNTANSCFYIRRDDNSTLWSVCDATMTAAAPMAMAVETSAGAREMYAMGSTELWFEDFGTGQLVDGQAVVNLDVLFLETVNTEVSYQVFLTPLGDCSGLYVASKSPTSFEVRELGGGKASIGFDYRIVAKRLGHEGQRLDEVDFQQEGDEPPDDSASDPGPGTDEAPILGESIIIEMNPGEE